MSASVKLTNWMRDNIVKAALKDVFSEREKALDIREDGLARAAYSTGLSEADRKLIDSLPDGFMKEDNDLHIRVSGQWVQLRFSSNVRVPYARGSSCWAVFDANSQMADSYEEYRRAREDYTSEYKALQAKIKALVYSCTTTNSLLTAWPEASAYLPKQPEVVKSLPAVLASDVVASMAAAKAKGKPVSLKLAKGA